MRAVSYEAINENEMEDKLKNYMETGLIDLVTPTLLATA